MAGGTASVIGGGKFSNGAKTAAFAHLLNAESQVAAQKKGEYKFVGMKRTDVTRYRYDGEKTFSRHESVVGLSKYPGVWPPPVTPMTALAAGGFKILDHKYVHRYLDTYEVFVEQVRVDYIYVHTIAYDTKIYSKWQDTDNSVLGKIIDVNYHGQELRP